MSEQKLVTPHVALGVATTYAEFTDPSARERLILRLSRTVVAQAEQIGRLQAAVSALMRDFTDADYDIYTERHVGSEPFEPPTLADYGISAGDMGDKQ